MRVQITHSSRFSEPGDPTIDLWEGGEELAVEREEVAENKSKRVVSEHREKTVPSRAHSHTRGCLKCLNKAGLSAVFLRNRDHLPAN